MRPKDNREDDKAARVRVRRERVARSRERTRLERRIATLEKEIEALEADRTEIERQLADPAIYEDRQKPAELGRRHRAAKVDLDARMATWEQLSAELEGWTDA